MCAPGVPPSPRNQTRSQEGHPPKHPGLIAYASNVYSVSDYASPDRGGLGTGCPPARTPPPRGSMRSLRGSASAGRAGGTKVRRASPSLQDKDMHAMTNTNAEKSLCRCWALMCANNYISSSCQGNASPCDGNLRIFPLLPVTIAASVPATCGPPSWQLRATAWPGRLCV